VSVANDGTESVPKTSPPVKKARSRPKQSTQQPKEEAIADVEPPAKRPRAASRKPRPSASVDPETTIVSSVEKPKDFSGQKRRRTTNVKEEPEPTPRSVRRRTAEPTDSPVSLPSVSPGATRSSVKPSSVSVASDMPVMQTAKPIKTGKTQPGSSRKSAAADVKRDAEVENLDLPVIEQPKTPRRSVDSGFSDFNPFQSGEKAMDPEKRRRKVSSILVRYSSP
jgi:hypothetical protein